MQVWSASVAIIAINSKAIDVSSTFFIVILYILQFGIAHPHTPLVVAVFNSLQLWVLRVFPAVYLTNIDAAQLDNLPEEFLLPAAYILH